MSKASTQKSELEKKPKPLTSLQLLEVQLEDARSKVRAEKSRIKKERVASKEKSHVTLILGSIVARGGKERIAKALASSVEWLKPEEVLAVEYYYGLRERPEIDKKSSADPSSGNPSAR